MENIDILRGHAMGIIVQRKTESFRDAQTQMRGTGRGQRQKRQKEAGGKTQRPASQDYKASHLALDLSTGGNPIR
jgi:hypothetical protein